MTREEKCKIAIIKGFTYEEVTGKITTPSGKIACKISKNGYVMLTVRENSETFYLYGHQFAWYFKFKICVELLDHINMLKTDNRIANLRSTTKHINSLNSKKRGTSFDKRNGKFASGLMMAITYLLNP